MGRYLVRSVSLRPVKACSRRRTTGYISDFAGRKTTLSIVMLGDAILFIATGFVTSPETMLAVRLLAGIVTPLSPSMIWVVDSVPLERKGEAIAHWGYALPSC